MLTVAEATSILAIGSRTYPGGKNSCYQHIINQIPPHRVYIEPFLGSGAIMRLKLPASINIGVDLDDSVLPGSLAVNGDVCRRVSADIATNGDAGHNFPDPIATINDAGLTAVPSAMTMGAPIANNGDASCKYLFIQANALDFLSSCRFRGDEFIYLDPPYLRSVRKSKRALYRHEFWTKEDHSRLLSLVRSLPCMVAISGYGSELYQDRLSHWRLVTFQAHTRNGMATECLWMNYDQPETLHDYRFLGADFRERERIKRKAKRWVKRFLELDLLERHAIISELNYAGVIAKNDVTAVLEESCTP